MIELTNVRIELEYSQQQITSLVAKKLRLEKDKIKDVKFLKKSVDARHKNDVFFACTLGVTVLGDENKVLQNAKNKNARIFVAPEPIQIKTPKTPKHRPIVCGAGPAGLFAGYILSLANLKPIIIERGATAKERKQEIEKFFSCGVLNEKTNVQFGEGGAGTFSDGKLTTNIKDERCRTVLETFVACGAPEEILYLSKPHLGTDNLCNIVENLREKIISLGGEFRFLTRLTDIKAKDNTLSAVVVENENGQEEILTDKLIIAAGHSATDVFLMLKNHGIKMEQKPFSVGVRIEHKQEMINESQFGTFAHLLPPADYKLSCHLPPGRSVYTFCMCPGGQVVAAASENGCLVVNGMSNFARNGENANSAVLCNVEPSDFGSDDILAGIEFQQKYERAAFLLGGGSFRAPAQLVGDFMKNQPSTKGGAVTPSYPLGVAWSDISGCLPAFAVDSIRQALPEFDKKIKGFAAPDAVLTGVETRSSSPIRVLRDEFSEASIKGIYPCGEGAGYAGGIMSAAVDGIRVAQAVIDSLM
ncbi:MAG: hypothetical protein IKB86_07145 [Clostridia bacterium]|nr:hypothetical protein [Clostridia bacterium]